MRLYFTGILLLCSQFLFAQSDSFNAIAPPAAKSISILTCGVGEELYASFGHTAVRVVDSAQRTDDVYNYGYFNFSEENFYLKFTLGKLPYYLDKETYRGFIATYVQENRTIREQVLDLDATQTESLLAFLENNLKPENRQYKYDFLFDNCATRVRDLFPNVLGSHFYFGNILEDKKISYRNILNQYLSNKHWERLGINLLLGSKIDSIMTEDGIMFLPDYVHKGLVHAKLDGKHLVKSENQILEHKTEHKRSLNAPLWLHIGILILVVMAYLLPPFRFLKPILRFLLLFVTGLLGVFMLFMWMGTNHQSCAYNYNVLWALPLNLIVAFVAHKPKVWLKIYGLAAISLLIVALALHVIGLQQFPLIEIAPLLVCMMYIYVDLYKNNVHLQAAATYQNSTTL